MSTFAQKGQRYCNRCGELKPDHAFARQGAGVLSTCKLCDMRRKGFDPKNRTKRGRRCQECSKVFRETGASPFCNACRTEHFERGLKWCPGHEAWTKLTEFYKGQSTFGLTPQCKRCTLDRDREKRGRRKAARDGGITQQQKDRLLKEFQGTRNVSWAAKQARIHRNTANKYVNQWIEEGKIREDPEPPSHPIPFDDLSEEARRALEHPGMFRERYFGRISEPWAVEAMQTLYEAYVSDVDEYLILNTPPGAGKTTLFSHDFVGWVVAKERALGREPRIQLGHRAEDRAKWYISRLSTTFTRNELLISDFGRFRPEYRGAVWSSTQLMVEPLDWSKVTEKEPTISAASQEGAVLSGRYKICLWDDLVDKKNSTTADQRARLVDFCEQEAETRVDSPGLYVLVGSRYGPEDLYHDRMQEEDLEETDEHGAPRKTYRRITYRAHYEDRCTGEHEAPYPEGCLLTDRLPWYKVKRFMRNERRFRLVWQQEDVDPQGSLAEEVWFEGGTDSQGMMAPGCFDRDRSFGQTGRTDAPVLSAFVVDPSVGNFWAILHILEYRDGAQIVYRGFRHQIQAPELIYRERDGRYTGVLERWWQAAAPKGLTPRYLIIETRAQQRYLTQYGFVQEWAQERGMVILPHDTGFNKADPSYGVEMLGPVFREGRLRLPYRGTEEQWFSGVFKREATAWPEGSSDDLVMAAWFYNHQRPHLLVMDNAEEEEDSDIPEWAKVEVPVWAQEQEAFAPPRTLHGMGVRSA